ncbi:CynX/NimT family MFS transporter [Nesterenkonia ebinurensis]|uniref:CynX/NimT family MFS transporter n=1 Tax=Nesterenkonia ebinurensis TaxID=2608252 RepID=UPI00123D1BA6|nr:MFS transporter [Nesterenkonia ebinurensis]
MPSRSSGRLMLVVTVLLVAANLRPAITVVGPLLERLGSQTGLSPLALGALGSVPIVAFGMVSPFVHLLGRRLGLERAIFVSLLVLTAGTLLRSAGGEAALYAGTALLAAAIGVGNVLVPAVVKRDFPDRVPLMTGLYTASLVAAAAVFSGGAVPLADWFGWEGALALPAAFALLAAVGWAIRKAPEPAPQTAPVLLPGGGLPATIWRQPLAWQVTLFFGLQSTLFYTLLTWFPAIQTSYGITESAAGLWLGIFQAIGVAASLITGRIMQSTTDQRGISAVVMGFMAVALLGIMLAPGLMPVWALCAGVSTGCSLLLALTFISLRAGSPRQVGRLSGMAQGLGYLLAAFGPMLAGALYQAAGTWTPVLWAALVLAVLQGVTGHLAGRNLQLD